MNFSESQLRTISNALHVAAVEYGKDAAVCAQQPNGARLVKQFVHESEQALDLAEQITAEIG